MGKGPLVGNGGARIRSPASSSLPCERARQARTAAGLKLNHDVEQRAEALFHFVFGPDDSASAGFRRPDARRSLPIFARSGRQHEQFAAGRSFVSERGAMPLRANPGPQGPVRGEALSGERRPVSDSPARYFRSTASSAALRAVTDQRTS
jgi:hypothetical protein